MSDRLAMTEHELQAAVIDLAHLRGWLVMHTRPARTRDGNWVTPLQGDKGFPDLVLARRGVVLIVELKSAKGRLSLDQRRWIEALGGEGPDVCVWRPSDWTDGTIDRALS